MSLPLIIVRSVVAEVVDNAGVVVDFGMVVGLVVVVIGVRVVVGFVVNSVVGVARVIV